MIEEYKMFWALALVFAYFVIRFFIRRYAEVYTLDFKGKPHLIGKVYLKAVRYGYEVIISEAMQKRSLTDKYIIVPDKFNLGYSYDVKACIRMGKKHQTVDFDDEMNVVF